MKLLVANWKMYLGVAASVALARRVNTVPYAHRAVRLVLCPSYPALGIITSFLKKPRMLGSQDIFWEREGAYTGEVGARDLQELGCRYVIIGHSERRINLHEDDTIVRHKVRATLDAGLTPVLCVGETLAERRTRRAEKRVRQELTADLSGLTKTQIRRIVFAYEPVWAIGTGAAILPKDASLMHAFIKKIVGVAAPVVYGGSVNPDNIGSFLRAPEVSGCLVGKASTTLVSLQKLLKCYAL